MGAEASLYERADIDGIGGEKVLEKVRLPKRYRDKGLDGRLSEERLRTEAKLMVEARALGIRVPVIYDIDIKGKRIVMERIVGRTVKDVLSSGEGEKGAICRMVGANIGLMHANGVIHGDLTTSNMILADEDLYFIDFSLGRKSDEIEEKGVDVHLLNEAFKSSHPDHPELFEIALEGYREANPDAELVIRKMHEIEKRGRYT
jgi:Kae1-associated kinase Bud32